jgi:hypothetical protein
MTLAAHLTWCSTSTLTIALAAPQYTCFKVSTKEYGARTLIFLSRHAEHALEVFVLFAIGLRVTGGGAVDAGARIL